MKILLSGDVEVINSGVRDSDSVVAIWGAGSCAASFLCNYGFTEDFDYFIDGNEDKWYTEFLDKKVYGPDKIVEDNNENMIVIIATMYFKNVIEKLQQLDFRGQVYSGFHVYCGLGHRISEGLEKNVGKLKEILADERSKEVVDAILNKRRILDLDYSDISEPNQYFIDGLIQKDSQAVFVDGGAFLGETVDEFIDFQQDHFNKVYSFEMDESNYNKIDRSKYDDRVQFLNYGLWNEETECSYDSATTSSALGEEGDLVAKCIPIDKICENDKVTFIKMDIEGAEIPALKGAYKTITKHKPQLAICLYHKPDDLYEIPFLLREWVPEYKFYIRHHSDTFTETVLYAVI